MRAKIICPTDAAALKTLNSFGLSLYPSFFKPAAIAPLETRTISFFFATNLAICSTILFN